MGQPLRNQHSDEQMAELEAYATEVFGDPEAARSWLDANLWELDNLSPRQIVARAGQAGLGRARDVLLRIEYGVYSQGPCPRPTACFVQNTRPWTLRDWPKSEGAGTRRDISAELTDEPLVVSATDEVECREFGTEWLRRVRSAAIEVPSAIIPTEKNLLLNPARRQFPAIAVSEPVQFRFDPRLLKLGPALL